VLEDLFIVTWINKESTF